MSATVGVEEKTTEVIADQLNVGKEKVKPESSIIDDLGADSLDTVELVMDLERKFRIEISDEDAAKLKTVGNIISYIKERIKKQTE